MALFWRTWLRRISSYILNLLKKLIKQGNHMDDLTGRVIRGYESWR